jgi:hypothetical protein
MIVFSIAKGFHRVSKNIPPELTQKELDRLRAITIWQETRNIKLAVMLLNISDNSQIE